MPECDLGRLVCFVSARLLTGQVPRWERMLRVLVRRWKRRVFCGIGKKCLERALPGLACNLHFRKVCFPKEDERGKEVSCKPNRQESRQASA